MSTLRSAVIHLARDNEELRPHLLRLAQRGVYVALRDLPPVLKGPLKSLMRYRRQEIEVIPSATFRTSGPAFEGNRNVMVLVNLQTGATEFLRGAYGGANPYEQTKLVDQQTGGIPIPPNGAVLSGETGGRGSFARIYIPPSNMAQMIPEDSGDSLSDGAKSALKAFGLKGGAYRRDYFLRSGLGRYDAENQYIRELADAGLVKVNRSGGIRITTKGRNVKKSLPGSYY